MVGLWEKALERWRSFQATELPRSVAFEVVYTAGFQLATAVLHAEGYRARGGAGGGHHWSTFYALRGLDDAKIDAIAVTLDESRQLRHKVLYDPTGDVSEDDLHKVADAMDGFFDLAHDRLTRLLPEIEGKIARR